jgi:hypothetical protein
MMRNIEWFAVSVEVVTVEIGPSYPELRLQASSACAFGFPDLGRLTG